MENGGVMMGNQNNPSTFKAIDKRIVDGRKIFVKSLDELQELEMALKEEDFFQRVVRLHFVQIVYTVNLQL